MKNQYDELINKFPDLYKLHGYATEKKQGSIYFSVGQGWFNLLHKLSEKILSSLQKEEKNPDFRPYDKLRKYSFGVTDIKEKYGTLRFYFWGGNEEIEKYVHEAEEESAKTCEVCGKKGKLRCDGGWYSVRCKKCYENKS